MKKVIIFLIVVILVYLVASMFLGGDEVAEEVRPSAPNVIEYEGGKTFLVESRNGSFSPNTFTLSAGENAAVQITGMEGNHGVEFPAFGITQTLSEGEVAIIQIPTDRPGTYEFRCHINCDDKPDGTVTVQ